MLRKCLCVLTVTFALAIKVYAQDATAIDTVQWERVAGQAEAAIDGSTRPTPETFERLRADIVSFRAAFDQARGRNAARIATLREQIASLGEPPTAEGAPPEPPEIVAERKALKEDLNALLAPVQRAEASFLRADSIVARIDAATRERQTEQLLTSSPSPLNPANWPSAIKDSRAALAELVQETRTLQAAGFTDRMRANLPLSILSALLGLVLIFRGRRWSSRIVGWMRSHGARGFGIWEFVISLLRVALPIAGIALLVAAAVNLNLLGPRLTELATLFGTLAAVMLGFRWVSERVFHRDEDVALFDMSEQERKSGRFYVALITLVVVLNGLLQGVLHGAAADAATLSVAAFPFFVVISFALFRLGRIMRGYTDLTYDGQDPEEGRSTTLSRVVRGLGTGAIVVACLAPLLMAVGYYDLATALQGPYVLTLAVLGFVLALQRFLADVYSAITGQGTEGRDALMPVLFGLVLVLLALPALALIWGARLTDLSEIWATFSQGFSIGDSRISPTDFLAFGVIFGIGYMLTRLVQSALRSNVLPKTRMDIGAQNAIVSGLGYVGIFLAAVAAITGAGIDLSSLAIVAGALSVGIGFGLQNIVSNFVSGIILLIERPISEGDWIEVSGGEMGYVRDISVRSTRIETFDKTDVIVPNADLVSGTVINYTRGNTLGRLIVPVGVAYGSDTQQVESILRGIAEEQPMVVATPPVNVFFTGFGADSLDFEVRCFLRDVNWIMKVKSDMNHQIAKRFTDAGIEIPFAQRDLWLRNPQALTQNTGSAADTPAGPQDPS